MDLVAENARLRALLAERESALAERDSALAERDSALAERDSALAAALEENAVLRARAEAAEEATARLERDLALLRRKITGPSSERVLDPNQLPLPIDNAQAPEPPPQDEEDDEEPDPDERKWKRRRRRGGRRKIEDMDHLRTLVFEEDVEDRSCPCGCGAQAVTIGHDVSWRLERIPGELVRHKVVQEKVAFPGHEGEAKGTVVTAPSPVPYALPKAMCANGLLAQIVLDKYADHIPLHRQEERFWRVGLDLSRQTMCGTSSP